MLVKNQKKMFVLVDVYTYPPIITINSKLIIKNLNVNKGPHKAKHDTRAACRQGKVE